MLFKHLSRTTKLFSGLIASVVILTIIVISISGNEVPVQASAHYINDNASADNKVEALKTMTADLLAVETKNQVLQKNIEDLQAQHKQAIDSLKQSIADQMQQALQQIDRQNQQKQQLLEDQVNQQALHKSSDYQLNLDSSNDGSFTWISDLSKPILNAGASNDSSGLLNVENSNNHSLLPLLVNSSDTNDQQLKQTLKPKYTIPVNATLTGATLMTPLVGRIPIDGKLTSPYAFKLVLSANNLTANGYPMPGVQGAVLSGIASGDMLGSCARGDIHSITFIFQDGTISTTEAQGDEDSLGYISSQTGNPCLEGSFHSDAAIFLGAQVALAGAQGYANALTSSQYLSSTTPEGEDINTLIGNANKAALGQGGSAAAQAAQAWWNRRVENSFDYVYVPNVEPNTNTPKKVVVNITREIPINYDTKARKVSYDTLLPAIQSNLD